MKKEFLDLLVCPMTQEKLVLNPSGTKLVSEKSHVEYDVVDGIPVLVPRHLRESLNT